MADLEEVCTRVAAVLFYIKTSTRLNLDFISAKGKNKSIDDALKVEPHPKRIRRPPSTVVDSPDIIDINNFYSKLSECGTKPANLSITPPYANNYKPE